MAGALVWLIIPTAADNNRNSVLAPPSATPGVADPAAVDQPGATPPPTSPTRPSTGKPGAPAGVAAEESRPQSATPSANVPGDPPTTKTDPTTTATPTTASTTKAPNGTLLKSNAGDVTAHCNGAGKSKLLAWEPATNWSVYDVAAGPAATTSIVFKKGASMTRMTVTCLAGTPTAVVLPL